MKNAFSLALSIIAVVIASICAYMVQRQYTMYDKGVIPLSVKQMDQVKATIAEYNDSIQNPEFETVQQVFEFFNRSEASENLIADFKSIPIDILVNVAKVCLDGRPCVKLSDIINNYKEHTDVYNKLVNSGIIEDVESLADRPCDSVSLGESYSSIVKPDSTKKDESSNNPI